MFTEETKQPISVSAVVIVFALYAVLETTWLFLAKQFYISQFARFSKSPLAIQSKTAILFIYPILLSSFFILLVSSSNRNWFAGFIFGLVIYATYNLTNKATLPGYPWTLVIIDTLWGTTLFGTLFWLYLTLSRHEFQK